MHGKEQRGHHHNEDNCRKEDGNLVPSQDVAAARSGLGKQAFSDEDAVVHAHAKDEG